MKLAVGLFLVNLASAAPSWVWGSSHDYVTPIDDMTYNQLTKFAKFMSVADCVDRGGPSVESLAWPSYYPELGKVQLLNVFAKSGPSDIYKASGYLAADHDNKNLVLAFRGSLVISDILSDIQALSRPYSCAGCLVHSGFYNAFNGSYPQIQAQVNNALKSYNYKLYVVGHSLGGAMAELFGDTLKSEHIPLTVITAAAPEVGNGKFADHIESSFTMKGDWGKRDYYRITHKGDIIPRVPFWYGYSQTAGEVYISSPDGRNPSKGSVFFCEGRQSRQCSYGNWADLPSSDMLMRHRDNFVRMSEGCAKT